MPYFPTFSFLRFPFLRNKLFHAPSILREFLSLSPLPYTLELRHRHHYYQGAFMRRLRDACIIALFMPFICSALYGQAIPSKYHTYDEMSRAIRSLASSHSDILKVESLGKTLKGRDIWVMTLRKGDSEQPRALLVVGGIDAVQIAGSEMALRFVEQLTNSCGKVDSVTKLLQTTTIYVIPRVNPDATEAYFEKPLRERSTNYQAIDDDKDGAVDEDDVDDVNKDGVITMMRVKDPRGEWMVHPEDARVMKKADPAKGEKGSYLLYTEGLDNDKDEQWNEDVAGGVDFNRNFPFNYQFFSSNAGVHQVSEIETRAVADFIFAHATIGAVFSFSPNDNLTTPWKAEPRRPSTAGDAPAATGFSGRGGGGTPFMRPPGDEAANTPVTSVLEDDQPYYEFISKQFLDITKLKDAPEPKKGAGAFSDWAYYHTGRWSFSVRPWWAPVTVKKDTTVGEMARRMRPPMARAQAETTSDEYTEQLRTLKWYDANGYKDIAVQWTKVKHPDFPDQEVEIGGLKPYIVSSPPGDSLNTFAQPYTKFITYLAGQLPAVALGHIKVEKVNDNVYRITLDVVNNGYLPTNSALGVRVRWPRNVYLTLGHSKEQSVASGRAKQSLKPIKGNGGYQTISWLVVGKAGSTVTVTVESPIAGKATETITLREGGRP
jgi:hypothetical protein